MNSEKATKAFDQENAKNGAGNEGSKWATLKAAAEKAA
jgi:hypothetical protein